jgi:uncharacterized surface protein with fasciclin (FAS1) repeats
LIEVLTYHVIPGKVKSGDFMSNSLEVKTVLESIVDIDATNGVTIEGINKLIATAMDTWQLADQINI